MKFNKLIWAACCLVLFYQSAQAAGLQASFDNASSLGLANAGSAVLAENATTVALNPAGMFNLQAREISLGAISINRKTKFADSGSSAGAFTGTGGKWQDQDTLYNVYAAYALSNDLRVGLGLKEPFKREETLPIWVGSAQEQRLDIDSTEVMPALAYKISDKTSIGGGANWQQVNMKYDRAAATLTAFSLNRDTISFNGSGNGWGWNAGLLHEFNSQFKVGLTYKSPIKYNIHGTLTPRGPTAALLGGTSGSAYMKFTSPESWTVSLMGKASEKLTLVGDVSLTKWDSADISRIYYDSRNTSVLGLQTNLQDTYRVAAGLLYALHSNLDLKLGYSIEQSPVKSSNSRLSSFTDGNIQWLSAGARLKIHSTRINLGCARSIKNDSRITNDQRSTNQGFINGNFNVNTLVVGLQLSQAF